MVRNVPKKRATEDVLGVHFNLPLPVSRQIQRALKNVRTHSFLADPFHPHITLYLCRFPRRHFSKLVRQLQKVMRRQVIVTLGGVRSDHRDGAAFFALKLTDMRQLRSLHLDVLGAANPLRGKLLREKDKQRLDAGVITGKERRYLLRYGYFRVREYFQPHITLGRADPVDEMKVRTELRRLFGRLRRRAVRVTGLTVGIYRYDNRRQRYVDSEEIILRSSGGRSA